MADVLVEPVAYASLHDALGRRLDGLPASFPEHVRQLIEKEIVDGRLPADERVTEEGLAQRFGVSRTPVREAMRMLEFQGLIVRPRGRGTYVSPQAGRADAAVLYELRMQLEGHLAELAAERIDAERLDALRALAAAFDSASTGDAPNMGVLVRIDSDFHWTIYNAAESDLSSIVSSYWARIQRALYERIYTIERPSRFGSEHGRLIDALAARDTAAARRLMVEHLRAGADALDRSFERTA